MSRLNKLLKGQRYMTFRLGFGASYSTWYLLSKVSFNMKWSGIRSLLLLTSKTSENGDMLEIVLKCMKYFFLSCRYTSVIKGKSNMSPFCPLRFTLLSKYYFSTYSRSRANVLLTKISILPHITPLLIMHNLYIQFVCTVSHGPLTISLPGSAFSAEWAF